MGKSIVTVRRFVGLDVHAETIAVAVAEKDGEVRSLGVIPNRPENIRRLVAKLGPIGSWQACYEAGPNRLHRVLATDPGRSFLCGGGPHFGSDEGWGSSQD